MKNCFLFSLLLCFGLAAYSQREIWGTVSNGGQFGHGYIFRCDSVGNNLVVVHHFDSLNGKNPGALLAASGNKLYGLTSAGGLNNQGLFSGGVFYEYDLTTSVFRVLQHFGAANTQVTGVAPAGDGFRGLSEITPGKIYGQVIRGQSVGATVFSYEAATGTTNMALSLPTYQGGTNNSILGNRLTGTLYPAPDGFLYGSTYTNSQCPIPNPNFGSIIRIDPLTNTFSIRYLCPCLPTNGIMPDNNFVTHDNRLYSVTKAGGAASKGVIYSFDPATDAYVNRYSFTGGVGGYQPSTLVKANNGKFYGTAWGGTPENGFPAGTGILFEFDPVNNQFAKKLDFTYGNGFYMNVGPFGGSLINGNNGKLYGVNANGVFEYNPAQNQTVARGRFPIDMGWFSPATPSVTAVCRKPSYDSVNDSSLSLCAGADFSFTLQSANSDTYIWKQNGSADPARNTGTLSFTDLNENDGGTWVCEMTNACGTTQSPTIQLNITPPQTPVLTQTGMELHASGNGHFQWIDCGNGNSPIAGANTATFTPTSDGSYAVILSAGGCTDSSACFVFAGLGLEDAAAIGRLSLFPNPASIEIRLAGDNAWELRSVRIRNAAGQTVIRASSVPIRVDLLTPGIYFITVETTAGLFHGKFVKTNP